MKQIYENSFQLEEMVQILIQMVGRVNGRLAETEKRIKQLEQIILEQQQSRKNANIIK